MQKVSSIEHDQRYKRTWGIGGGDGEVDSNGAKIVSRQPSGVRNGQAQVNAPEPSGPYIKRITNDAREDEMEENLEAVGSIIGNLKNMAMDMGSEIDKQNKQIDSITSKLCWTFEKQRRRQKPQPNPEVTDCLSPLFDTKYPPDLLYQISTFTGREVAQVSCFSFLSLKVKNYEASPFVCVNILSVWTRSQI
ncbi:Synaptosomal-associated protein 23 [Larimichthys crocea]|uniref:Uncharacterized protein n=1 Tax=Larimichthys crocea TaxID=215358 RepID=A0ACD3RQW3_LARCR|nr:Synaptosomal-associated protein 23 [Larimichthys crocea]